MKQCRLSENSLLLSGRRHLQRSHQCAIGDSSLGPLLYARLLEIEQAAETGTLVSP